MILKLLQNPSSLITSFGMIALLGCFHGFNATILAYGQTGSGKTHTMGTGTTLGTPYDQIGIVPRVFKLIFEELEIRRAQSEQSEFKVKISFLELYNEELHDLLDPASIQRDKITGRPMKEMQIREEKSGLITIRGLKDTEVTTQDECLHALNTGINHRVTSKTGMNDQSSRSHAIFTISIEQKISKQIEQEEEEQAYVFEEISSKFHFVDLAGSERIKKTGAQGQQLKEGISINKGLLCLGQVISALTNEDKKQFHIPYRDSKLTRILQDSLGGNSRTTMIACVSPAEFNYEETLSTVRYASRARNIKNKPVINRDPNSMLIEALRSQISQHQNQIKEYQDILQKNGIQLPSEFGQKIKERQKVIQQAAIKQISQEDAQDIKKLKVKLSHQEKEILELIQNKKQLQKIIDQRDASIKEIQSDRDDFALRQEAVNQFLSDKQLSFEYQGSDSQSSTLDKYKSKLQEAQIELDKRDMALKESHLQIQKERQKIERNERILRKHVNENNHLRRQISKQTAYDSNQANVKPVASLQQMRNARKTSQKVQLEEFNSKVLQNLETQFDELLSRKVDNNWDQQDIQDQTINESDKDQLVDHVRKHYVSITTDLKDLFQNEWSTMITDIEQQKNLLKKNADKKLKEDGIDEQTKARIQLEHNTQMEKLNNQVAQLQKDKQKKEDSVKKQLAQQEARIKTLEQDLERLKKKKENAEQTKKYAEDRFFKFKVDVQKDINFEKKKAQDERKRTQEKEKDVQKMKIDIKKTEALAQQAISQLKGMQKRAKVEKEKRDILEEKENQAQGIDLDIIREWITINTEAMLKQEELKEYRQRQLDQKDKIENEMLEEGDRLTEVLVLKETLELEQTDLKEESKDEGRQLEIEEQIKDLVLEIQSITQSLEDQSDTLEYVLSKLNQVTEEIEQFDFESVTPMSFKALDSIESARATLKTFFSVVLDLNIYKKDLERKCIDQDECVVQMESQIRTLEARLKFMIDNGGKDGYAEIIAKKNAITSAIGQVEEFVDQRDIDHLNLNQAEQQSMTKLNLSKIVNNLRKKLQEQEAKNQRITLKLDQAIKQKEVYKQRADEAKSKQNSESFGRIKPQNHNITPQRTQESSKSMSFKQRRAQKQQNKEPAQKVESLADRRQKRTQIISDDSIDDALANLKDKAQELANRGLEAVQEDADEIQDEEEESFKRPFNQALFDSTIENPAFGASNLEPDSFPHTVFISEQKNAESQQEWKQNNLVTFAIQEKLIDFFALNTHIVCIFAQQNIKLISLKDGNNQSNFHLSEIEFDCPEDDLVACTLEQDIQLIGLAFPDVLHVFEFDEEASDNLGLAHVNSIDLKDIHQMLFVEYFLILLQQEAGSKAKILCYELESEQITQSVCLDKANPDIPILLRQIADDQASMIYAVGSWIGKLEVPSLESIFKIDTGHSLDIHALSLAPNLNQIITTSPDETIRFFSINNGMTCGDIVEEMEQCDMINSIGDSLITRVGTGEDRSIIVWQFKKTGGIDEDPIDEIELTDLDKVQHEQALNFKIKGQKTAIQGDDRNTDQHIIMLQMPNQIVFSLLYVRHEHMN